MKRKILRGFLLALLLAITYTMGSQGLVASALETLSSVVVSSRYDLEITEPTLEEYADGSGVFTAKAVCADGAVGNEIRIAVAFYDADGRMADCWLTSYTLEAEGTITITGTVPAYDKIGVYFFDSDTLTPIRPATIRLLDRQITDGDTKELIAALEDRMAEQERALAQIQKGYVELPHAGYIDGYYLRNTVAWQRVKGLNTIYVSASAGDYICVPKAANNLHYLAYAIFAEEPTIDLEITNYGKYVNGYSFFEMPFDGYVAISGGDRRDLHIYKQINTAVPVVEEEDIAPTVLFIGDSISTKDAHLWKGYLETYYGYKYCRNISGAVAPASGGITIIPPETEDEDDNKKSIWYRCANQALADYTFDVINLYGGTNDLNSCELGSIDDEPYLDTTETRPETLTFAASLMGCIEMLQRDYPNVPIVLNTVIPMPTRGSTITENGITKGEAMAILQCEVAMKYNLLIVPWYWDMDPAFLKDGVHPSEVGALRMANLWYNSVDKYLKYQLEDIKYNRN